jgi:hypothetical protein
MCLQTTIFTRFSLTPGREGQEKEKEKNPPVENSFMHLLCHTCLFHAQLHLCTARRRYIVDDKR